MSICRREMKHRTSPLGCNVQVPQSIRWAHGYNPFNTSLGKPCP